MKQEVINKLISLLNSVNENKFSEDELNELYTRLDVRPEEPLLTPIEQKDMLKYFFAGWYVYSMLEK
jgi:hypothetical protein